MAERKPSKRARRRDAIQHAIATTGLAVRVARELDGVADEQIPVWTLARLDQVDAGMANVDRDLITDMQLLELGYFKAVSGLCKARYPFERKIR